ncbi:MAG: hypothetical protein ACYC7J_18195 [Syntrophales bacterium]
MPATSESKVRTRAFARVIGPFLVLVPGILVVRAANIGGILSAFFQNDAIVWTLGSLLFLSGLVIIAFHQYWSGAAAILISLFGWFLALRGLVLLAAPQLIAQGAAASLHELTAVRIGFSLLVLIGLWLTYVGWFVKPPESGS